MHQVHDQKAPQPTFIKPFKILSTGSVFGTDLFTGTMCVLSLSR